MLPANFLPTPTHVSKFNTEVKKKFFAAGGANAPAEMKVFLDTLDFIKNELAKSDSMSLDQQEGYLDAIAAMDWSPAAFSQYPSPQEFLGALEKALDAAEAQERVDAALAKAAGVPTQQETEATVEWLVSQLEGTPKQVAWAKDIVAKKATQVQVCRQQGREIPTSAKWWIDHRDQNLLTVIPTIR